MVTSNNGYVSRDVSPNRGTSIEDYIADGEDQCSQEALMAKFDIVPSRQIRIVKLLFMRYQHPDLQKISTFLKDFGLSVAKKTETQRWFRGYGVDQYVYHTTLGPSKFLGGAFEVEEHSDLERALDIPGAKVLSNGIEELHEAPGGGHMVTLADAEGFPISLVHGQTPGAARQPPETITLNYEIEKPRIRKFQRFKPGPAEVFKLGHYGLAVKDFDAQFKFYMRNFNFMPSNILYVPPQEDGSERKNVAAFAHINRGSDLVDHHSLFLVTLPPGHDQPHVHHCSFEIHDFDTQAIGHDWLSKKGYRSAWGVGRHIIGSQIFDYWWDPNDFMVEHYIDGDVVNDQTPVSFDPATSAKDAAWGPDVPDAFLQ